MDVTAIDNPMQTAARALSTRSGDKAFAQQLQAVRSGASDGLDPQKAQMLRKAAQQLVATTFIQPMLAKMRDDPFKSDLFHGGRTEEIFGEQLDTILSERIVAKADFSIVDAVYNTIAERATGVAANGGGVNTHA